MTKETDVSTRVLTTEDWPYRKAEGCPDCFLGEPHYCPDLHREYRELLAVRRHTEGHLTRIESGEDNRAVGIAQRLRGSAHSLERVADRGEQ